MPRIRKVVAINTDGSVAGYFERIKDAVDRYGMDRHSIYNSCRRGNICHGFRWLYEEEYREIYQRQELDQLKYTIDPNRDRKTYHFKKGHKIGRYNSWSPESKERVRNARREQSLRMNNNPHSNWGKNRAHLLCKPIRCITTGKEYPSINEASIDTGIPPNQISLAIKRKGTTHKMIFERITN